MDIDRVRYFHTFASTGSLVKACEILHISQPALSKALRQLESEIGLKLLEPDGRGLRLTEHGLRFRQETSGLLQQWLELPKKISTATATSVTRLGSFEVFTTYFLSPLMAHVDIKNLELHELGPGLLEEALAKNKIDLAITYVPVPRAEIDFIEVTKIKMGVFAIGSVFRNHKFEDLPFVVPLLPAEGTPSKVIGLDGWPDHEHARSVKYRVTMMESALELCRKGHAVAYLPEFIVHLHNANVLAAHKLTELKAPIRTKDRFCSVYVLKRKTNSESALFRDVAKCLRSLK